MADDEKQKCPPCPQGLPGWLQTFADLMSLLLTFFVLLLSFANTDLIKYKEALGSIKDAFGVSVEEPGDFEGKSPNPLALEVPAPKTRVIEKEIIQKQASDSVSEETKQNVNKMTSDLKDTFSGTEGVAFSSQGGEIRVKAPEKIFFRPGRAVIRVDAYVLLKKLASLMREFNFDLVVEGHSDNLPIKTRAYPSNWELSASRAAAVIRFFETKEKIQPRRLTAVGFGSSRPVAPNTTRVGRAKNRRVEFVFLESKREDKFNKSSADLEQEDVF